MSAKSYKDLIVWQKADVLSLMIHKMTESFPADERYRLVDQMRRAASSIGWNISEGFARFSPKEKARFYEIGKASAEELKVQIKQAKDRKYCANPAPAASLADEVCAMLFTLRRKVLEDLQ